MTKPQKRVVTGLAPRSAMTGDLSRLQAKNRPATLSADVERDAPNGPAEEQPKRITVYLDPRVFARARGVYRATSHLEDDKSWSQFVEKALFHESQAREQHHNAGKRYDDSNAQLSPGRPLTD